MQKYKKRKDGRYLTQIQIGYQDHGRPKYKNIYARSLRDLDEKATEFKAMFYKGIITDDKNFTFGQWANIWIETYRGNVAISTREKDAWTIKKHLAPLHNIKLKNIKLHHLQSLINEKEAAGYTGLVRHIIIVLKAIFRQAIINDFIVKNPAENLVRAKYEPKKRRQLYDYERCALNNADLPLKARSYTSLCLYAGLRKGEALALTIKDIDLIKGTINVDKTSVFINNKTIIKPPKSEAGIRIIPIVEPLKTHLTEYIKSINSLYLFTCLSGKIFTASAYEAMWSQIMRKMNEVFTPSKDIKAISEISAHYLRHTYATDLYYAGVDIKMCQYLMGHTSIETTMDIYAHLEGGTEITVDKIEQYLTNKSKLYQSNISQSS